MPCPFPHENIDTLYGVPPCHIGQLPVVCTCGKTITYADEVTFVSTPSLQHVPDGTVEITQIELDGADCVG